MLVFGVTGMAVGAMLGTILRSVTPQAPDAPQERATLYILIPLVIAIGLWIAGYFLTKSYFSSVELITYTLPN